MTEEKFLKLADGEEIVAELKVNEKAVKADIFRGAAGIAAALVLFAAMLALHFEAGVGFNSLAVMAACAAFILIVGAFAAVSGIFQLKFAGLILTKTKIKGAGGFPFIKKIEIKHCDNKGFQVFKAKRGAYFVRLNDVTLAYMENPEEFEATYYETVENNLKEQSGLKK